MSGATASGSLSAVSMSWRALAVVLVFSLTPGAAEAVENTAHLVTEGHLAHDGEHADEHAPEGDEHGCNSVFHLCACHVSASFVLHLQPGFDPEPTSATVGSGAHLYEDMDADGVRLGLLRPPIT